jgi:DnaJ-class molecular chaperone
MKKTLYEQLDIQETASHEEIKIAYRKLANKYHPDKNGGDKNSENLFKEINTIYHILSNNDLRKKYDDELRVERIYRTSFSTSQRQHSYKTTQKQHASTINEEGKNQPNVFSRVIIISIIALLIYLSMKDSRTHSNDSFNYPNNEQTGEISFDTLSAKQEKALMEIKNMLDSTAEPFKELELIEMPSHIMQLEHIQLKQEFKTKDSDMKLPLTGEIKF